MVTPLERKYVARRGDLWEGEGFKLTAPTDASFWSSPTVAAKLRTSPNDPIVHYEFPFSPSITTEAGKGVLSFSLGPIDPKITQKFSPGIYVGDIEVSSASFAKSTICTFTLEVKSDVTY